MILGEAFGRNFGSRSIGSFAMAKKPAIHCFGHIHESFGDVEVKGIKFINTAFEKELRFYVAEIDADFKVKVYML